MGISFNAASLLNGNGINVQSVVTAILAPENAVITQYQNQQTDLSTNAGLLSGYNNNLTSLEAAVVALANPTGPLASQSATSSDSSILTASAATTATAGTHQIVVSNLATTGTLYTNPLTNGTTSFLTSPATTGDIKLQVGGGGGTTHDIVITQGSNDTLNTLASYINTQNWGVTANVVTDSSGARLALYSQSTGTPGALAITNNDTGLTFNTPVGGTNASLTIDGVPYSSATNTVTGAIGGVTLNLASAAPGTTVQLTVGPDTTQATNAINAFVSAYNTLIGDLNTQFTVDPTTNSEGPLGGDVALRSLQSSLLNDVSYGITGNSGLVNLASLGIEINNDGTLTVNQTAIDTTTEYSPAFSDVLAANPSAVQSFFQNASGTGFAQNFNNDLANLTDPTTGILNLDIADNKTHQNALTTQIANLQDRLTMEQAALTLEYDQVNANLEAYPSLLLEVTSEIAALNGNYSTTSGTSTTSTTSTNTTPATGTATG
ncbi:MAG: flagellar filament capping protein FliD [Terriglobales bacterium]